MITVLGRRNSANVQKVMWTLGELDLAYERHDVGGSFGYPDDYPSPNQVVPSIRDGDLALWESNACVRYLARTYGRGNLWPDDPHQLALADVWMEWSRSDVAAFFTVFQVLIRGLPASPDRLQRSLDECNRGFAQLDAHLEGKEYVCGEALSFADIAIGIMMYRYMTLPIERPSLSALEAWYQRLVARPAYARHVMVEYGSNPEEWAQHEQANAGIQ